jgi:hypothetical protein
MTVKEFAEHFDRLCKGFRYCPQPEQAEAFFERLKHCNQQDWREAVTDLLCSPKFPPSLNVILDSIERRAEQRRRTAVAKANQESPSACAGKVQSVGTDERERKYNRFRMELLSGALMQSKTGAAIVDDRSIAQRHAEDLADWLQNPGHTVWAKTITMSGCTFHSSDHSLHACLVDEISHWQARGKRSG